MTTLHVFTGPTLPAARARDLVPQAVVHPPVRLGDLLRLGAGPGDVVLLIDGLWHQAAPVRHKEILMLLADGVTVAGAASMGALRAAELTAYGMLGAGAIYEAFRTGTLTADDEVAVLHTPEGTQVTEALVNLRTAVRRAHAAGRLSEQEAAPLEAAAAGLPYTRRTWPALAHAARDAGLQDAFAALDAWRRVSPWDLKREDAERALHWSTTLADHRPGTGGWQGEAWRTSFTRYWASAHPPAGPGQPPLLALLQHQQLYDPNFPARWRARVLAAIAGVPGDAPGLEKAAATATAERGLRIEALTGDQAGFWLTDTEMRTLDGTEQTVRILVRSACWDGAWDAWPAAPGEAAGLLADVQGAAEAVTACLRRNAAVAQADPRRTIDRLDAGRIGRHLAARWGLPAPADQRVRDAAARDRGLRSFASAVEVARTFYLTERTAPAAAAAG
ncbi:TfuA-like protein [Streptomyces qinglanensis]|uniref:TfuA-like protein n=1 Tax=Streptomyces qinglanensis TaxID=943816 RepID=UPI003D72E271